MEHTWKIRKQFIKVAAYIEDHRGKKVRIFGTI